MNICKNSKGIKLSRNYGTFEVIEEISYMGNIVYIVDSEDDYYKGEPMIISDEGVVIIEDGKSKEDFIKYIDRLEAHYGAFQYDFRWTIVCFKFSCAI